MVEDEELLELVEMEVLQVPLRLRHDTQVCLTRSS